MKSRVAQYMNEIVSIAIMLLMTVALITGQLSAGAEAAKAAQRAEFTVLIAPGSD